MSEWFRDRTHYRQKCNTLENEFESAKDSYIKTITIFSDELVKKDKEITKLQKIIKEKNENIDYLNKKMKGAE